MKQKTEKVQKQSSEQDLKKRIYELETQVQFLTQDKKWGEERIAELDRRAESYKCQLIVYKGLVERFIDKLLDK